MDSSTTFPPVINEQIWEAWVRKGKLAEKATDRKLKNSGRSGPRASRDQQRDLRRFRRIACVQ